MDHGSGQKGVADFTASHPSGVGSEGHLVLAGHSSSECGEEHS